MTFPNRFWAPPRIESTPRSQEAGQNPGSSLPRIALTLQESHHGALRRQPAGSPSIEGTCPFDSIGLGHRQGSEPVQDRMQYRSYLVCRAHQHTIRAACGQLELGAAQRNSHTRLALGHSEVESTCSQGNGDLRGRGIGYRFCKKSWRDRLRPVKENLAQDARGGVDGAVRSRQDDSRSPRNFPGCNPASSTAILAAQTANCEAGLIRRAAIGDNQPRRGARSTSKAQCARLPR